MREKGERKENLKIDESHCRNEQEESDIAEEFGHFFFDGLGG